MLLWKKARGYDSLPGAREGGPLYHPIQTPSLEDLSSTGSQVHIEQDKIFIEGSVERLEVVLRNIGQTNFYIELSSELQRL